MIKFTVRRGARVHAMPIRAAIVIFRAKAHLPIEKTLAKFDEHVLNETHTFAGRDVMIDPQGDLGWYPAKGSSINELVCHRLAGSDYFAFRYRSWAIVVHEPRVEEEEIVDQKDPDEEPFAA